MSRAAAMIVAGAAGSLLLSGCVAAAVPLVAGAGIVTSAKNSDKRKKPKKTEQAKPGKTVVTPEGTVTLTTMRELPPPSGTVPPTATATAPASAAGGAAVPAGMQFLYGSGEAAALSLQAYQGLWSYVRNRAEDRKAKSNVWSVVLAPGSTLENPRFMDCGAKPLAIVLDVDETALLNLGYEAFDAQRQGSYDDKRWDRWEQSGADKVAAVPGAAEALAAARREGVTVIFNSNRLAANAAQTAAAIKGAGLGPAEHGKTLYLRGDDGTTSSAKDGRRWLISQKYCVVALVGDQLGDFSDLFNAGGFNAAGGVSQRRAAAGSSMVGPLWGAGWFMLPNPVYGSGLKGGFDDVFPADKRWNDPMEGAK